MVSRSLLNVPLGYLMSAIQTLRRRRWAARKPSVTGAHAIALTPAGKVVLVKLRYERGWYVPGGGRKSGESAQENALRELREEVGLLSFGSIAPLVEEKSTVNHRSDLASVFMVRDVVFQPRWSLEIEDVMTADPHNLPADMSPRARRWIEAAISLVSGDGLAKDEPAVPARR